MAWIQTSSAATSRLYVADLDAEITFNENGTAQVSEEVAAALIDRYDTIERYESDS